jgi:hypothetical protein
VVTIGAATGLGVLAASAGAAPVGAKNAFIAQASCDHGQSYDIVVNNANGQGQGAQTNGQSQAEWAPAHLIGTNQVFHPTAFDTTFTLTGPAGTFSFTNTDARTNQTGNVTCELSGSQSDGVGDTVTLSGSVIGTIS